MVTEQADGGHHAETTGTGDGDTLRASPFVERFAADLAEAGMQRMAARVFACLLASEGGALSAAELARRLRISPAAVSGAVRHLSRMRMVSREREPGSRRGVYRVHEDTWFEAFTQGNEHVARWLDTLQTGARAVGGDTAAGSRLLETRAFFEFLQEEMAGAMERWRRHRASRDGGSPPPAARRRPGRGDDRAFCGDGRIG